MSRTPVRIGSEIQVNTTDRTTDPLGGNSQYDGQITALSDGGYLIAWTDDTSRYGTVIRAQRFDAGGHKVGAERGVAGAVEANFSSSAVQTLSNGDVVIAYTIFYQGNPDHNTTIGVTRYHASDGTFSTQPGLSAGLASFSNASLASFADGGYVVAGTTNGFGILAEHVDASNHAGANFEIAAAGAADVELATLASGNFAAVYTVNNDIHYRVFTSSGTAVASDVAVAGAADSAIENGAAVAAFAGGGFVVAWTDDNDIRATIYDSSGSTIGATGFLVNTTSTGEPRNANVVVLAGGNFVVTWNDIFSQAVKGQAFDGGGNKIGHEFTVRQSGFDASSGPDGALLSDGHFAYAMGDTGSGDEDVVAQVWDPAGNGSLFDNQAFKLASFGFNAGGWTGEGQYPRLAADVSGDGRADLVGFGSAGVYVALANADGTFQNPNLAINGFGTSSAAGGWSSNDGYHRTLGDVNGDGHADIVGFGSVATYVSLANSDGTFQPAILAINSFGSSAAAGGWSSDNYYHREVADVNGDGKADIIGFGSAGVYVALATTNGSFAQPALTFNGFGASDAAGGWSSDNLYHRELADVNGDGKADIVGFGSTGVYVALATGGGSFAQATLASNAFGASDAAGGWTSQNLYPRHVADVNGDGMADLVGFGGSGVYLAFATGSGTFRSPGPDLSWFAKSAGGWTSNDLYPRVLADLNHDGTADIVGFGHDGVYTALANHFDLA